MTLLPEVLLEEVTLLPEVLLEMTLLHVVLTLVCLWNVVTHITDAANY